MSSQIPIDVYRLFKKLDRNIKFKDIKIICNSHYITEDNSLVYKAGNYIIKPESKFFISHHYPQIQKLYSIDNKYILNYKNNINLNPNLFYYEYIDGCLLCTYPDNKNNVVIENIIEFIKFYINIDIDKFDEISNIDSQVKTPIHIVQINNEKAFNNPLYNNLKKIYDISIKNQKKTKKKLLLVKDLNAHNIIVDKNNNIRLIDMSDGIMIDYYHLYIHKYFSFLWIFGEKVVNRALEECNIDDNLFVKELSLIYFLYQKVPTNGIEFLNKTIHRNWIQRLSLKYKYRKIVKEMVKSLSQRYPD